MNQNCGEQTNEFGKEEACVLSCSTVPSRRLEQSGCWLIRCYAGLSVLLESDHKENLAENQDFCCKSECVGISCSLRVMGYFLETRHWWRFTT
jgi:hypothetical protein